MSRGRSNALAGAIMSVVTSFGSLGLGCSDSGTGSDIVTQVVIIPPAALLEVGETIQFFAFGVASAGDSVEIAASFSATGGTITSNGLYSAGDTPGDYAVVASLPAERLADTAQVTVSAAPVVLTDLFVLPASVTLFPGNTQLFVAFGVQSSGDTVAVSAGWSASGGSITSEGLYTAGNTVGAFEVVGTHQTGLADTASVTISAGGGGSGSPDPTLLPDATGQAPNTAAYNALAVHTRPAGYSYLDPETGVRIWKVTSATVPFNNSGGGVDYSDAGQRISQPWQSGDKTYYTVAAYFAFNGGAYWLVDFNYTDGTFGNWRALTGSLSPDIDLNFSFSSNPATPRIAYVINNGRINRIDTGTMTLANTGNFPHSNVALWLQVDRNDAWFMGLTSGGQAFAWNSQTNTRYTRSFPFGGGDEVRLERDGNYGMFTNGGNTIALWNLTNNTVGPTQTNSGYWGAHLASVRNGWSTNDNDSEPVDIDVYVPSGNNITHYPLVHTGVNYSLVHHSGNWIQDTNDRTQWAFVSPYGSSTVGKVRLGIGVYTLDGTYLKLLCHHYDTSGEYFRLPWGTPSPDGRLVVFNSNMNGAVGRHDLFLAAMPTR